MLAAICFLLLLGVTAVASGAGPAAWLWPRSFRGEGIDLAGMMLLGFGAISLVATYLFELDYTVFSSVPIALALSVALLAVRALVAWADLKSYLTQAFRPSGKHLLVMAAGLSVGGVLTLPSLSPTRANRSASASTNTATASCASTCSMANVSARSRAIFWRKRDRRIWTTRFSTTPGR